MAKKKVDFPDNLQGMPSVRLAKLLLEDENKHPMTGYDSNYGLYLARAVLREHNLEPNYGKHGEVIWLRKR